jgi:hypothetical protein
MLIITYHSILYNTSKTAKATEQLVMHNARNISCINISPLKKKWQQPGIIILACAMKFTIPSGNSRYINCIYGLVKLNYHLVSVQEWTLKNG